VLGCIPESFGSGTALDSRGLVIVAGAALGVVWGLMRGNSAGWDSPEVVATLAAGLLLALAFVAWERRAPEPMLPMRFFRSRAFSSASGVGFLLHGPVYSTVFFLPQFLQAAQGHGPLGAGLRLLPWTATLFVFAPIAGRLVNRIGERPLVVVGLLAQAAGMAWVGLIAAPDLAYGSLVAPLILAGAGVSMAMPSAQNAVLGAVAPSEVGKASGTYNTLRFLGGAFGIALAVAVFAATGSAGSPQAFSVGFGPVMRVAVTLSLLGAVIGLWLPGRPEMAFVPAKQRVEGRRELAR
jgi:MFS family permease